MEKEFILEERIKTMRLKKIIKTISWTICSILCIFIIILGEYKNICGLSSITGVILGLLVPVVQKSAIDCTDISTWQESLRRLLRGNILKKNDFVRISFAYLFRIKINNKYLLVKSTRGTQKFQPIGGAYKFNNDEQIYLSNHFAVVNDDNIPLDTTSKNDYRLRVPVKYLKKFVKRFDKTRDRENIDDLGREFKEELDLSNMNDFSSIKYRYCGRHFTNIEFSKYFKCYEILLADIVELLPSDEQVKELQRLVDAEQDNYIFATAEEINSCGVKAGTHNLFENIADHSFKILQETELKLISNKRTGKIYNISLERQ